MHVCMFNVCVENVKYASVSLSEFILRSFSDDPLFEYVRLYTKILIFYV